MNKLIVIEGLDGSGKATQAKLLASALAQREIRVREVSFPDYDSSSSALVKMYLGGEFGDRPGDVNAYAASTFFAVDRYASFKKDWWRDYAEGVIISDRYTTSNAVHQCSKLDEEYWDAFLDWLFDLEYDKMGIPTPDLVVYLRVDPVVSQELMMTRYEGHAEKKDIHEKNLAYLRRCQKAAEYCAQRLGWRIVDCCDGGRMRSIESIQADVIGIANAVLSSSEEV